MCERLSVVAFCLPKFLALLLFVASPAIAQAQVNQAESESNAPTPLATPASAASPASVVTQTASPAPAVSTPVPQVSSAVPQSSSQSSEAESLTQRSMLNAPHEDDTSAAAVDEPSDAGCGDAIDASYSFGQGVNFKSCDGNYLMHVWSRSQLRYSLNRVDQPGSNVSQVMEVRRASLFFAGNAFGEHNKYFLQLVFAPRDVGLTGPAQTSSPIFDMFFTFDYLRDFSLRVGQYKPFFSRQFIAAWGDLQFVDRSIAQNEFHLDRDIGFDVFSTDVGGLDLFRYYAGAYVGQGRNSVAPRDVHFSPVVRFEVLPFGTFDDYKEGDLSRNTTPKLSLGVAYAYLMGVSKANGVYGPTPLDMGTTNFHELTGDLMFKLMGFSLTGEVYYRRGTRTSGGAVDSMGMTIATEAARNGTGYFVQGGYLLPGIPLEFSARGGQVFAINNSSMLDSGEVGGALSYYAQGHPFKIQADYFRSYVGPQTLSSGSDQVRLQLQMQM